MQKKNYECTSYTTQSTLVVGSNRNELAEPQKQTLIISQTFPQFFSDYKSYLARKANISPICFYFTESEQV